MPSVLPTPFKVTLIQGDDLETRSVAASHSSRLTSNYNTRRNMLANISRESSKESSEDSDELPQVGAKSHRAKLVKQQSRVSDLSANSGVSGVSLVSGVSGVSTNISDNSDIR